MDQPDPLCLLRSRARAGCWKPHSPQRTLRTNEELRMNRRWPGGARRAQDQRVSVVQDEYRYCMGTALCCTDLYWYSYYFTDAVLVGYDTRTYHIVRYRYACVYLPLLI